MADPRKLREMILDQAEAKDLKPEKLITLAGMPPVYFEALIMHQPQRLPAYPFMRGHLERLAEILGLDSDEVIAAYKREFSEKFAGASDRLPSNRFALPANKRRYILVAGVIALLLIGYGITRSGFFGTPALTLEVPPLSEGPYVVQTELIDLRGSIEPGDTLFINGTQTPVASDGTFVKSYSLSPELNTIEFIVKRFLGKEIRIVRQVYYQESEDAADSEPEDSTEIEVPFGSSQELSTSTQQ